jgi:hypothetical protein
MNPKFRSQTNLRYLYGFLILLLGLGSAAFLYQTGGKKADSVLGYEQGDEGAYPIEPGDSKKYQRDLELYGGKANVLLDEFRRWLIRLWPWKMLAIMTVIVTVFITIRIFHSGRNP